MSAKNRKAYMDKIATYKRYDRNKNSMKIPAVYDCADVATHLYGEASAKTDTGRKATDLKVDGKSMTSISEISSKDFFPGTDNIDYYDDKAFDNANVEVGTVMVWKKSSGDTMNWTGHVATVVGVTRDKDGHVTNIDILQGHTGGHKTEVVQIINQADLDSYRGDFQGFGEIGKGSAKSNILLKLFDNVQIILKALYKNNND